MKIVNPIYTKLSKLCVWLGVIFVVPVKVLFGMRGDWSDVFELFVYFYLIVGNYVLGYRLMDPPGWAYRVMPRKWIEDWVFLSISDSEGVRSNKIRLFSFVGSVVLLSIIFLAVVNEKI
ncbi:hypothetical protein CO608_04710 [Lysobacteraceae bacterium NML08-0793]|nr:hypothetical protein CO608_04710 [Xanthomonadaceae bacterium NML08-0793]